MKIQRLLYAAGIALIMGTACSDLDDIYDEMDGQFTGFITNDFSYTLTSVDYKTISEDAILDATTQEEINAAKAILEGGTALTDGYNNTYIPSLINEKSAFMGFGVKSIVQVTYKFRDSIEAEIIDTTQRYLRRSLNAWMLLTDAGYYYDFENGTDYEDVDLEGWVQVFNGGTEERTFLYRSYGGDRYAQVTAYSSDGILEEKMDVWLISPVLDLDDVNVAKNLEFFTSNAYPNGAQLIPYIMTSQDPATADTTRLSDAIIADDTYNNYQFISSGILDLSEYSGEVYIAFRYLAEVGQTTTFQVDDFKFDFLETEE